MRHEDAYKILGVKSTCTDTELKTAYRKKMMLNHPDKGGSATAAAAIVSAKTAIDDYRKRLKSSGNSMDEVRRMQDEILLRRLREQALKARQDLRRLQVERQIQSVAWSIRMLIMLGAPIIILTLINGGLILKLVAFIIFGLSLFLFILAKELAKVYIVSKITK